MAISVGDAVLKITGDTKGLDQSLQKTQEKTKSAMQKMQKSLMIVGAAFTAVGVAGLKMADSARKMNAQLGVTALNLGITTKEMRDLALETTNVTFPLKEVIASFDFLARAGIKNTEVLKATATAFDTLGDAIGLGASQVTEVMVPAMKTFRLSAEEIASKVDMMTFMVRNSTISLDDFNTMVGYTDQEMVAAGFTIEDMTAAMIYMSDNGVEPGRVMLREWMKAVTKSKKENISMTEALGMTSKELEKYKEKLAGATGMAKEYGDVLNSQLGIMDKLRQKWAELTLQYGSFLQPLEPILATMTALGPLMMLFSTVLLPRLTFTTAAARIKLIALAIATKAITAAQWLWNAAMTANPIGLIIAGIAALVAAGIALWKNWDKVLGFFKGLWINMKIIFAAGVKHIINTILLPFIEFFGKMFGSIAKGIGRLVGVFNKELGASIEAIGDKLINARRELNAWADDMAAGARVEKSIRETEKALADTNEEIVENYRALYNNAHVIQENIDVNDDLTEALLEQQEVLMSSNEVLEERLTSYQDLLDQYAEHEKSVERTIEQIEYERSEAGKLRVTIKDVTVALFDQGWAMEKITRTLFLLGEESDNVNAFLEAVGLTALEVAAAMEIQSGKVNNLSEAYARLAEEADLATLAQGGEVVRYSSLAHRLSEEQGMSVGAAQATIDRYRANPDAPEFVPVRDIMKGIMGFEHEGIAMRPMLATIAEKRPEAVLSIDRLEGLIGGASKGVANIIIMLDSKVIGRKIGAPLMDEIIVKTGMRT